MLRVAGEPATRESVQRQLDLLLLNGWEDLERITGRSRVLVLRYEEIYQNHPALFQRLEEFLETSCPHHVQADFGKRFAIERVRERSRELVKFDRFDPEDQIHGQHVSENLGRPSGYLDDLSADLQQLVVSRCRILMEQYSYLP